MASFGASEEIWEFTGEPGHALIADTRRLLHSGSRCSEDRLLFVADYTSGFAYSSRTPHHDPWKLGTESDRLSLFQRLALGHPISAKGLNLGSGRHRDNLRTLVSKKHERRFDERTH